jgi:hypothetical protein
MPRKSIHTSEGEQSFFHLMMAEGCFRRALHHPKAGGTASGNRTQLPGEGGWRHINAWVPTFAVARVDQFRQHAG